MARTIAWLFGSLAITVPAEVRACLANSATPYWLATTNATSPAGSNQTRTHGRIRRATPAREGPNGRAMACPAAGSSDRNEVGLTRELDELRCELRGLEQESRSGAEMLHEIAGVARAKRDVSLARVCGDPLRGFRVERDLLLLADATQDLRELLLGRRLDLDLVLNASQERFIHQRGGRAVRGEDEEDVERHLDLSTVGQREEIDIAVERHDPAVEEHLRRGALPAEVVDEEHASARLHLERRLVHLRVLIEGEVEVFERELTTDLNERTGDRNPAAIEPRIERDERPVPRRVKDADDLLTDEDRVRKDDAAAQHRGERLRDRGLPGAGGTKEKDRAPAVDRGAELAQRLLREYEMRQRLANLVEGDLHAADGLGANAIDVRGERHRSGSDVPVLGERFARTLLTLRRDDVDVRRSGHPRAALHLDEMLVLQKVEDAGQDLRKREADRVGEIGSRGLSFLVEGLQNGVGDEGLREAGAFAGDRCERAVSC